MSADFRLIISPGPEFPVLEATLPTAGLKKPPGAEPDFVAAPPHLPSALSTKSDAGCSKIARSALRDFSQMIGTVQSTSVLVATTVARAKGSAEASPEASHDAQVDNQIPASNH